MQFEFRGPGAPKGIPAALVGAQIQALYERDGGVTPAALVDEARPPAAPLHQAFEWDNGVAAEQYRQVQARQLVRSVVLAPQPERRETAPVIRAFVSVHRPDGETPQARHYKPIIDVLGDALESEELKRRLRHELLGLRRRYFDLLELDESLAVQLSALEAAVA